MSLKTVLSFLVYIYPLSAPMLYFSSWLLMARMGIPVQLVQLIAYVMDDLPNLCCLRIFALEEKVWVTFFGNRACKVRGLVALF